LKCIAASGCSLFIGKKQNQHARHVQNGLFFSHWKTAQCTMLRDCRSAIPEPIGLPLSDKLNVDT
jgi:hypothetical protein